jgi:hypothetical protein
MTGNYDYDTPSTPTAIVERHRDNRMAMIVAGIVLVVAIVAGALYFSNENQVASQSTSAQTTAAAQQSALAAQQATGQAANATAQAQMAGAAAQSSADSAKAAHQDDGAPVTQSTPAQAPAATPQSSNAESSGQ